MTITYLNLYKVMLKHEIDENLRRKKKKDAVYFFIEQ